MSAADPRIDDGDIYIHRILRIIDLCHITQIRVDSIDSKRQDITDLNLKDRMTHKPNQLSGGEQQRVAVARAMINNPSILFMDEPTGNLDPNTSEELVQMILRQKAERRLTIIMVTHNLEIAARADRHLVLTEKTLFPAAILKEKITQIIK